MKKEKKKQLIALFILLMFGGSTLAYAAMSILPSESSQKYIFDEPLSTSDEAYFFKQNMVVVRVYYDEPSDTITALHNILNDLNQKMIIERINIDQYPEHYNYVINGFETHELPLILLRGNTEIYLNGEQTYDDLLENICSLYFQEIDECI